MKTIERYEPKSHDRVWGVEMFIAETEDYLGKVLYMRAGTAGGLQLHRTKDETFHLFSGRALVQSDDGTGELISAFMEAGESYRVPPGAPHKVTALTDCVFFECSLPVYDDRVRLEETYGLPAPTGEGELKTTGNAMLGVLE